MAIAYGGCIEQEGWELDNEYWTTPCPRCGAVACAWSVDRVETGSLNVYRGLACDACGFEKGDRPDDDP